MFSKLTFCWMNSLMRIGSKRWLDPCDLYPLLNEDKTKILTEKLESSWNEEVRNKGREARLTRALLLSYLGLSTL